MRVQELLKLRGIEFEVLPHESTYSAQRMARAVHVCGDLVAKTVLLRADDQFIVAVLPATHQIYLEMALDALDAATLELADELDFDQLFPDCEHGVVPPFGSFYGLTTLVDASLTEDDEIVFESNGSREAIRMKYRAFELIERPIVAVFAYHVF